MAAVDSDRGGAQRLKALGGELVPFEPGALGVLGSASLELFKPAVATTGPGLGGEAGNAIPQRKLQRYLKSRNL